MFDRLKNPWLLFTLFALILVVSVYFFFDIKFKQVQVNTGPGPEVRQNPYLAAQKLMDRLYGEGKLQTFQGLQRLSQLPSTNHTIIIDGTRGSLSNRRLTALIEWTEQGGHLVVIPPPVYEIDDGPVTDVLLTRFDISVEKSHLYEEELFEIFSEVSKTPRQAKSVKQQIEEQNARFDFQCPQEPNLSTLARPGQTDLHSNIDSNTRLIYGSVAEQLITQADNKQGTKLLQVKSGQGKLTVITDMKLWHYSNLACFDNALLLSTLIKDSDKAWLLYYEEVPGLVELLWKNAKALVLASILFILLWLWRQTLRFGPQISVENRIRRNYLEHLSAAARYRWHSGEQQELIQMLRQGISRTLMLRHQDYHQLGEQQQIELICRLSGMTTPGVQQAMFGPVPNKEDALINLVQGLQQLRKCLS